MLKLKNLSAKHKKNSTWPQEARIQAVTQYLACGNMALVAALTGVPHQLLRQWKRTPWWAELTDTLRQQANLQTDAKLSKIVDKSLDAVMDRLENGEFIYNQKTGQMVRKQVSMKDAARVSVDLLSKRELLRGNATERVEQAIPIADQLKALAIEFARWQNQSKPKAVETIDIIATEIDKYAFHEEWEEGLQSGEELGEDNSPGESEATSGEGQGTL